MENTTINQRFEILSQNLAKNPSEFARKVNKPSQTISNIVNGNSRPSFEVIEAVCVAFPKINKEWLIMGNGEMFKDDATVNSKPGDYLLDHLNSLERNFNRLSTQLESKDKQIEGLQRIVDHLMGKPEPVILTHPASKEEALLA